MARPRKLNATKQGHRTKEELEASELKENGLNQFDKLSVGTTPSDLTVSAQQEWERVVPLLENLPISDLDYTLVKKYCELVDINDDAYQRIQKVGTFDSDTNKKRVLLQSIWRV